MSDSKGENSCAAGKFEAHRRVDRESATVPQSAGLWCNNSMGCGLIGPDYAVPVAIDRHCPGS